MAPQGTKADRRPGIPPATAGKPGGPLRPVPAPSDPAPTPGMPGLRDRLVLLLTNGMSVEAAEGYCVRQGAMDLDTARRTVAEARQRITVAADYARDEQLGKAVMRLEDLYGRAIRERDARTALQAQRELNRLLNLHGAEGAEPGPVGSWTRISRTCG